MPIKILPPSFYRSIRSQMMAWLGTLMLVAFLVMGYLVYTFLRIHQESLWTTYLQDINQQTVSNIDSFLSIYGRVLKTLSLLNPQDAHTYDVAQQILREYVAFKEIVWVDDTGKVLLHQASGEAVMGNLFTVRQSLWFQTAMRGERFLSSAQPVNDGDYLLLMALPGKSGGVIAGLIRLDVLNQRILISSSNHSILTWMMTEDGEVLMHPNPKWIQSSVSEQEFSRYLLKDNATHSWSGRMVNLDGVEVLAIASPIQETSWIVFSEVPFRQVKAASLRALAVLGGGVLALFIALAFWSRWYLGLLIFAPLHQFRQAIERMREGKREVHLSMGREDELGDLARAFHGMLQQIREREVQLEERNQALEVETARRKQAMLELQRMAEQLEIRVQERTMELEHEVAERRQAEKELRLNLQRLSLLSRLLKVHDPEEMLGEMCRELVHSMNAALAILLLREHSHARLHVRSFYSAREMSLPERLDLQSDTYLRMFQGNHEKVVAISLSVLDTHPPFLADLQKEKIGHLLLLYQKPSRSSGSLLILARDGNQPFDPVEVETLEMISGGILQVIELSLLYASLSDELSERRRIENLLVYQNTRDSLTGLYNRRLFEERISYRAPHNMPVCVIALDLDHLKKVNDIFGHTSGDEYIRLVAQAIQASVRSEDLAARIGGDEFVVILNGADESAGEVVIRRIQESLYSMLDPQNPIAGMVRVSMGLAVSHPGEPLLETYRRADSAMYAQKQLHRRDETADPL